ncbi:thiazole synthase [Candidatus Palauibacter sp.]|uniref:thiazole synthase n=1 Tax=Candidatus Palauibacter sp. TaxID=3101350 RepID=UPI003B0108DF
MDALTIDGRSFDSRLIVGTGKYPSPEVMLEAIRASGAGMVTVAVRRVDIDNPDRDDILRTISPDEFELLPNTAGCYTSEDAIRFARLGRAAGMSDWVKLEVIGDPDTLFPHTEELIEATRVLVAEGFTVLPYTNDDLVTALRLEDAGAAAVMPLASPIGSGLGLLNPLNIRIIKSRLSVPVIVDAGVGTASDACATMEEGVDGVLMNTAIAAAEDPVEMARAMRLAVEAGRLAYVAGRMPRREWAVPSSPVEGLPPPD